MSGMTGKDAAERILKGAGIYDVRVEHISGQLSDHYDPRSKVLRLSGPLPLKILIALPDAFNSTGNVTKWNKTAMENAIIPILMSNNDELPLISNPNMINGPQ